jgi:putative transposase
MGRRSKKKIIKHITLETLNKKINIMERSIRVLKRLYFIRFIYQGVSINDACTIINITRATGYNWLNAWNNEGFEGLVPNFSGGPKPKLTEYEKEELMRVYSEIDVLTLKEVRLLIKERFGVDYSLMQIWRILRSRKMDNAKSSIIDYSSFMT